MGHGDEDSQRSFIKDSIKDSPEFLPNVANKVEKGTELLFVVDWPRIWEFSLMMDSVGLIMLPLIAISDARDFAPNWFAKSVGEFLKHQE